MLFYRARLFGAQCSIPRSLTTRQCVVRPFTTSSRLLKKTEQSSIPPQQQDEIPKEKPKPPRASAGKNSLRRVSMEAERSRLVVNRHGMTIIDPHAATKRVTAYCLAEQYNINKVAKLVRSEGHEIDPCGTLLFPQVVHIQKPIPVLTRSQMNTTPQRLGVESRGDIFIFPSGTVVAWNVSEKEALHLVEKVLPPAALNSHSGYMEMEKENLEYIEDVTTERSKIVGDTIILGTAQNFRKESATPALKSEHSGAGQFERSPAAPEVDTILAKIAFSSGLARSTKLAVLERLTDSYVDSTRSIPTLMSRGTPLPFNRPLILRRICVMLGLGSRLPFSRPFILRKTGELLSIRAQLNLYSELTDSLPDLFWDSKHELGLESYYDLVGKTLDIGIRIKVLNEKMDYAQEIARVLRETLSERHNLRLEWGIIILIFIEVIFEIAKLWREHRERNDPKSLEGLLKRFLERSIESS